MPFDRSQYSKPLPQDANPLTQDGYPNPPIDGLYCDQQDCAIDWQRPNGGLDHYSDAQKNWIAGAIKHPGALTKKAKSAGESPMAFAESHKSAPGKTGKQARLAITLRGLGK